jgi:RimJ/RimL family protein N-acetyltransferase
MLILETERLSLHHFEKGDAAFLLQIMNHPDYHRYIGDRELRSVADAERFVAEAMIPPYERQGFGFWQMRLRETGERAGFAGIIKREVFDVADVGYAVDEKFYGKGFAQEATRGVLGFARETLGFSRVGAMTDPKNSASINVLIKCGFSFERLTPYLDKEVNFYLCDL